MRFKRDGQRKERLQKQLEGTTRVVGGETGKCDSTEGNPVSLSRSNQC